MINAVVSQSKGISVFDDGGKVGFLNVINIDTPEYDNEIKFSKLLSGAKDIECLTVIDLNALKTHLLIRKEREELLHAALVLLDSNNTKRLKQLAAKILSEPTNYNQWSWVEGVLLSVPLPDGSDPEAAASFNHPYSQFFYDLTRLQSPVSVLRNAWFALPDQAFSWETREQVFTQVIRKGLFSILLQNKQLTRNNPFSIFINMFSKALKQPMFSTDTEDYKSNFLEHYRLNAAQSDVPLIWNSTPWRYAWLATEWQYLKFKAASTAAEWVMLGVFSKERNSFQTTSISQLSKQWNDLRYNSHISESVSLLGVISSNQGDLKDTKNNIDLYWGNKSELRNNDKLCYLISKYFCAEGFEGDTLSADFGNESYLVDRAIEAWLPTFDESQGFYPNDIKSKNRLLSTTEFSIQKDKTYSAINTVICVHALDQVFEKDGGVVRLQYRSPHSKRRVSSPVVEILNLKSNNFLSLKGMAARIIIKLYNRLEADFDSRIPNDYCGWSEIDSLQESFESQDVEVKLKSAILRMTNAGFSSEIFERREGKVRLNPEFTCILSNKS